MAYTTLASEDDSDLLMEDGGTVLAEDSTGEPDATGDLALTDPLETYAFEGAAVTGPALGDLELTDPLEDFALYDPETGPLRAHTLEGMVLVTDRIGLHTHALKGSATVSTLTALSARAIDSTVLVSTTTALSARAYLGLALLGPPTNVPLPDYVSNRPERIRPPATVEPRKTILAPRKTLPDPVKDYDPEWMRSNQEQVLRHLDDTLSASSANQSVLLASPNGKVFEFSIDDDGNVKIVHRQG